MTEQQRSELAALASEAAALRSDWQAEAERLRAVRQRAGQRLAALQASLETDRQRLAAMQAETARLVVETDAILARWEAEDAALDA